MSPPAHIRSLITRLARLDTAEAWGDGLNPAQLAALDYLARANRFSRSPSHLADYFGTTRGTVSQTLKSLLKKGLIREYRSDSDRRAISYELAEPTVARYHPQPLERAAEALGSATGASLASGLEALLSEAIASNGARPFGVCKTCRHFRPQPAGGHCGLLHVDLAPPETEQICHEQVPG